jgi:hypothetical protein
METVVSKLQETGQQFAKQRDVFVTRTRAASIAFFGETRDAGLQLVGAVQVEAKRWRRFATQRAAKAQSDVRSALSVPALERIVLTRVDDVLRAIDGRVRARIAELEQGSSPAPKLARRAGPTTNGARSTSATPPSGKSAKRSRKAKAALPPIAA